jgi:hypothetical protein
VNAYARQIPPAPVPSKVEVAEMDELFTLPVRSAFMSARYDERWRSAYNSPHTDMHPSKIVD